MAASSTNGNGDELVGAGADPRYNLWRMTSALQAQHLPQTQAQKTSLIDPILRQLSAAKLQKDEVAFNDALDLLDSRQVSLAEKNTYAAGFMFPAFRSKKMQEVIGITLWYNVVIRGRVMPQSPGRAFFPLSELLKYFGPVAPFEVIFAPMLLPAAYRWCKLPVQLVKTDCPYCQSVWCFNCCVGRLLDPTKAEYDFERGDNHHTLSKIEAMNGGSYMQVMLNTKFRTWKTGNGDIPHDLEGAQAFEWAAMNGRGGWRRFTLKRRAVLERKRDNRRLLRRYKMKIGTYVPRPVVRRAPRKPVTPISQGSPNWGSDSE